MNFIDSRISFYASEGKTPYEIEEILSIPHYTIHQEHHQALMEGYAHPREKLDQAVYDKLRRRNYCKKNREALRLREKERRKWNPEKQRAACRRWLDAHRDEVNAKRRLRYREIKEKQNER